MSGSPDLPRAAPSTVSDPLLDHVRPLLEEYSPSCLLADALQRVGAIDGLHPVVQGKKAAGRAVTAGYIQDETADCPSVLLRASRGDMIVLANSGQVFTALWGGLLSTMAQQRGISGVIVDGAVRDVDEIRDLGFPVWAAAIVPRPSRTPVHLRTEPVEVNCDVIVRGVLVHPGDMLVADDNGIMVVRPDEVPAATAAVATQLQREREIRSLLESGEPIERILTRFLHT